MALKKMTSSTVIRRIFLFAAVIFFLASSSARAATLQINSDSTTISPGGITMLSVVLNSEGVAINNAEAKIVFPTDLLEVVSINKSGSIFSLWVEEPTYSNSTGVINFNGGIPTPGYTGSFGSVVSIVFKAKAAGKADIIFTDAAVRANDGLGTDVLRSKQGKSLTVLQSEQSVPPTVAPVYSANLALQITSPTHTNQDLWHRDRDPLFRWSVPAGADAIQTTIDSNTKGVPHVTYIPTIKEKSVKDLEDGIWYFKARARSGEEWGPIATYVTRIDNTIPKINSVIFSYDDNNKVLNIKADVIDETSGIDYYNVFVNDLLVKKVPVSEFTNGNYDLAFNKPGDNAVKLVAVDRAGNSVEATGAFKTTPVFNQVSEASKAPAKSKLLISIGSFAIPALYLGIIILCVIFVIFIAAFRLGNHYSRIRGKLKTRTALVQGDNLKVLLLLKKRLEKHLEILQQTRHNRVLSKEEKDIKEEIEIDLDEVDRAIEKQSDLS